MTADATADAKAEGADGAFDREWIPESNARWNFDIDIVGRCNLACPSCPVGNLPEVKQPSGFMKPELLDRIVSKALAELDGPLNVALYNWTEPFLHPYLPDMIGVLNDHGVPAGLSSNLNLIRNIDAVMEANPAYLKVSVSGFDQSHYGQTHRRGDIEEVKKNMRLVAEAHARAGATTRLEILFHRYLGNHEQEAKMTEYATSLGFEMTPVWAYLMPMEKVLAIADPEATDVVINEEDRTIIDRLALGVDEALDAAKAAGEPRCRLRDRQMAINCEGLVTLCCTVYDPKKYGIASYLDTPLEEIQRLRFEHTGCDSCMQHGIHTIMTYGAEEAFDAIALANVARAYPDARLPGMAEIRKTKRKGLKGLRRKLRKRWKRWVAAQSTP